jgi:hypothetical protein
METVETIHCFGVSGFDNTLNSTIAHKVSDTLSPLFAKSVVVCCDNTAFSKKNKFMHYILLYSDDNLKVKALIGSTTNTIGLRSLVGILFQLEDYMAKGKYMVYDDHPCPKLFKYSESTVYRLINYIYKQFYRFPYENQHCIYTLSNNISIILKHLNKF